MFRPDLTSWNRQYDRMKRLYEKLSKPYESSVENEDDLQHFFQDCWHLRDWITNDLRIPQSVRDKIDNDVEGNKSLRIVADLAIASKHLARTRKDREGAYMTSKGVTLQFGNAHAQAEISYTVTLRDGSTLDGLDVAREAFEAWEGILRKFGLI
jgi:hypothetical protein